MPLEGDAKHAVHVAVGVGGFEEADAAVVGVADEGVEVVLAEIALDGAAVTAGSEGEASDLDVGLAQGDPVGGFGALGEQRQVAAGDESAGCGEGSSEEVATGETGHGCLRRRIWRAGGKRILEMDRYGEPFNSVTRDTGSALGTVCCGASRCAQSRRLSKMGDHSLFKEL